MTDDQTQGGEPQTGETAEPDPQAVADELAVAAAAREADDEPTTDKQRRADAVELAEAIGLAEISVGDKVYTVKKAPLDELEATLERKYNRPGRPPKRLPWSSR